MVKLVLLVAVIALGADALLYDGAYTQTAYHQVSATIDDIRNGDGERPAERPA